jgi:preprotein translocase subunit SecE
MANSPQVETVSTILNKTKLVVGILLVGCAVAVFYALNKQEIWLRWVALIVLFVLAMSTLWSSDQGKQFVAYGKDSIREGKKVVWSSRKDAGQMTFYVFVFVFLMASFLFLTDKALEWFLYDLILGWKR